MNTSLADFYEWILSPKPEYQYVFDAIYNQEGYDRLGKVIIITALFVWIVFYVLVTSPYIKKNHWNWCFFLTQGMIAAIICSVFLYRMVNSDLNPDDETLKSYLLWLYIKMFVLNFFLTWIPGLFSVLILKNFSTHNIHLP
ncbi:MAG: hypothetical protein OXE55_00225 [Flavobacteriaceae bacterium]|nr:hypothetical protein [Flavobacteriaceae bacterium]